jgi:putative membrane protein insertion efficiency factor
MRWLLIHLVLLYRVTLGRLLGGQCRYVPTCSQYAIDAINKHGPWRGGWRAIKRICRCHPFGGSGVDLVPERGPAEEAKAVEARVATAPALRG